MRLLNHLNCQNMDSGEKVFMQENIFINMVKAEFKSVLPGMDFSITFAA